MPPVKKTTPAKGAKPKKEKPLTRRKTALIMTTGAEGDSYILDLVHKTDEVIRTGRPPKYNPTSLWKKFVEYVEHSRNNPARTEQPFGTGFIVVGSAERPLTLLNFYLFAGIDRKTFAGYEENDAFFPITTRIRDVIFSQKFDGAARGVFKDNLIARDLGIGERLDIAGSFDPTKPIKVEFGKGNANAPKTKIPAK